MHLSQNALQLTNIELGKFVVIAQQEFRKMVPLGVRGEACNSAYQVIDSF
jgi:hypothetical protein